jgi:DNA-directed RNA polymerase subunit RPC12/RpoP
LPDAWPDHPANPGAAQAKPTARSTTLDYAPGQSSSAGPMESGMKMEGMEHGEDAHAGHSMDSGNQEPPHGKHEGHEAPAGEPSADYFYTCSMDPEVIRPTPGKCPKCGMKLTKKPKTKRVKQ